MASPVYSWALARRSDDGRQTMGDLFIFKDSIEVFQCNTLELPWKNNDPVTSCYPPGTYNVLKRWSRAHGWHFHVLVPRRALRLFHCGNYAASPNPKTKVADTKGCTLVGKNYQDITGDGYLEILNSGATMQKILQMCPVNSFLLSVTAPPTPIYV